MNLLLLLLLALVLTSTNGFTNTVVSTETASLSRTRIFYQNEDSAVQQHVVTAPATVVSPSAPIKKPTIYPLSTLQELYDFLNEDQRLTAVKYYAPWCKKCQRVGLHYKKLAYDYGDGVVARRAVDGPIRCAEMEYSDVTAHVMDALQIEAVPTLQLYRGTKRIWESGTSRVQELTKQVELLLQLQPHELDEFVERCSLDDAGILEQAYEDSFFDNGYCYDWEDEAACV
ncbi:expressed unknown protein [Seminavis robusta]|uniref:Thioredoxin domain-containing protein n=1 Tax=Seminavis robusta TaxID=568900 RepID=A0A9N8ENI6_9STRA|nr:expressed unknown protein [Seminavis robusta]|eukprot:Sro1392_g268890.1 n/a (229) ;mRNA; f:27717-28496